MTHREVHSSVIVEEEQSLTLDEYCRAIHADKQIILTMVEYELLQPQGENPDEWRFDSSLLRRGRIAASFYLDLEMNLPGVTMALRLLDQISSLQCELEQMNKLLKPSSES